MLPNYHIIQVSTSFFSNHNVYRVRLQSELFKQRIYIPFSNEAGASRPSVDSAISHLQKIGFKIIGTGEGKDHYYLISDTFEPIK